MLLVAIDRAPHSDNKFDFILTQAKFVLDKVPEGDATIIVGDSAYSYNKFIHNINEYENVAIITRELEGIKRYMRNMKIKKKAVGEKKIW